MAVKLDVRVYPLENPTGATKAFASFGVNDMVAVRGVRVVEDKKGLFVSMPQSRDEKNDKYHDIAFPRGEKFKLSVTKSVLDEYHKQTALPPEERGYEKPDPNAINSIDVEAVKLDIDIYPISDPQGKTLAFAKLTVDDLVTIRGIRVVDNDEEGKFVSMPQTQDKYLKYHNVAFAISTDLSDKISECILDKFENPEKTVDRKPSLGEKLAAGATKAAEHTAPVMPAAAKTRNPGVLE